LCLTHHTTNKRELQSIIDAVLHGEPTVPLAVRATSLGVDAAVAVTLAAKTKSAQLRAIAAAAAAADSTGATIAGPHTPSGAIPPHVKGSTGTQAAPPQNCSG